MSQTKRITGDLTIDPTGSLIVSGNTTVTGNLTVIGTSSTINTTDSHLKDNIILLNNGEAGAGVTLGSAGLEIDRGSSANSQLVFDESIDRWRASYDAGSTKHTLMQTLEDDTSPAIGGDIDMKGFNIVTTVSNQDINLIPNGTGTVGIISALSLKDEAIAPSAVTGSTLLYASTQGGGGSGLFVVDGVVNDELVTKSKAIVYGLIF
jgi:hypothetical protein